MKINLPHVKQATNRDCGPAVLKSILAYFGKDISINEMYTIASVKPDEGFWTIDLASLAKRLGFDSEFFTINLGVNSDNMTLYQGFTTSNTSDVQAKFKNAQELGVKCSEESLSLDNILSKLSEDSIIISLVDWDVIFPNGQKKYRGHFIALCGYDDSKIYFMNPAIGEIENMSKEIYEVARKAKGTDEDLVVIKRIGSNQ